jgi:hypothetical protein
MDQGLNIVSFGHEVPKDPKTESAVIFKAQLEDFEQGKNDEEKQEEIHEEDAHQQEGIFEQLPDIRRSPPKVGHHPLGFLHGSLYPVIKEKGEREPSPYSHLPII